MRLLLTSQSISELEYVIKNTSASGIDIHICSLREDSGILESFVQFSSSTPIGAFLLGMYKTVANQIITEGGELIGVSGDISGIRSFLKPCIDDDEIINESPIKISLNFYDRDAVKPTIQRFNNTSIIKILVLSEKEDPSGHIVELAIPSSDPKYLFLLGEIFYEEYEMIC